jgi:hypothetical protein
MSGAGASQELAEATADLMSKAVLSNLDALVTKDYLDARLDARFGQLDVRFRDVDARIDQLRTEMMGSFRLIHALQAILLAGVFLPQFQSWFGG